MGCRSCRRVLTIVGRVPPKRRLNPLFPKREADPPSASTSSSRIPTLCPRYVGGVVDVAIGASPDWMQTRLHNAGIRPISNIVDVTNYVLLEMGHPMHAFDLAKLSGAQIRVRTARPEETLRTLDGQLRTLSPEMLVIADARRAVAVAGVMGGADSEVTGTTKTIVLESAYFNPVSVRRTSKKLGLKTEASMRFERGADPAIAGAAMNRALALIDIIGAGRSRGSIVDRYPAPLESKILRLRRSRIGGLLGGSIPDVDVRRILDGLGFVLRDAGDGWDVVVPTRRVDIAREVDLIEEIARHYGFDRIPVTFPALTSAPPPVDPRIGRTRQLRGLLTGAGFSEAVTFGFMSEPAAARFVSDGELVPIANPLSENFAMLRPSVLPGLIDAVAHNRRREQRDVRLFEIGARFTRSEGERRAVACAWTGMAALEHWSGSGRPVDFFDLKAVVERVCEAIGVQAHTAASTRSWLTAGQSADVMVNGTQIGVMGQLLAAVHRRMGNVRARLAGWMLVGSAPASLLGVWVNVQLTERYGDDVESVMGQVLGGALLFGAVGLIAKSLLQKEAIGDVDWQLTRTRKVAAVLIGVFGGFIVGLTSVGSGVFFGLTLLVIFPLRAHKVVGTDIFHAAALLYVAGAAHWAAGNIDFEILAWLLLGSIPGVLLGGRLTLSIPERPLRLLLAGVLGLAGIKLLDIPGAGIIVVVALAAGATALLVFARPAHVDPLPARPRPRLSRRLAADADRALRVLVLPAASAARTVSVTGACLPPRSSSASRARVAGGSVESHCARACGRQAHGDRGQRQLRLVDRPRGLERAALAARCRDEDTAPSEHSLRRPRADLQAGDDDVGQERDVRGAGVLPLRRARGLRSEEEIGLLVAVHVADSRDRPAGEVVGGGAVEPQPSLAELREVDPRRRPPAEDHVHRARIVAAVLVGLLRADDDVCPAVPVEVSGSRDGARGVVELGGAVDSEASPAKRREVDPPRSAAEDDIRGARVLPPVGIGRRRADEDVGAAVAVDVARARDRPADSTEDDFASGVPVDLEAALTERCEVDGVRRALPEDDVGRPE